MFSQAIWLRLFAHSWCEIISTLNECDENISCDGMRVPHAYIRFVFQFERTHAHRTRTESHIIAHLSLRRCIFAVAHTHASIKRVHVSNVHSSAFVIHVFR